MRAMLSTCDAPVMSLEEFLAPVISLDEFLAPVMTLQKFLEPEHETPDHFLEDASKAPPPACSKREVSLCGKVVVLGWPKPKKNGVPFTDFVLEEGHYWFRQAWSVFACLHALNNATSNRMMHH
ncbi:unnamed protein product [Symbiodinium sp. CCMP2592]|nr:unnamed protein product [Symbiodinium sp. CCMP2592]